MPLDHSIESLLPQPDTLSGQTAIMLLASAGKFKDASDILAYTMHPRVALWWGICCVEWLLKTKQEFLDAHKGLSPEEARSKKMDDDLAILTDTSEIDNLIKDHNQEMDEIISQIKKKGKEEKNLIDLVIEQMESISTMMDELEKKFPKNEVDEAHKLFQKSIEQQTKELGYNPIEKAAEEMFYTLIPSSEPEPDIKFPKMKAEQIFEKIQEKTSAVRPYVQGEIDKYFPLKFPGLPTPSTTEQKQEALEAAKRWLFTPSDENGARANQAALSAQDGPESLLAYSALWSSTNLMPGTGNVIPPPPGLYALGISKAIFSCAIDLECDIPYDDRYELFLGMGLECATGISTWDEAWKKEKTISIETTSMGSHNDFGSRSGFGRN
ncbi:MAG: hypothetical protein RR553_01390 [Akkermansia sp.]